MKKWNKIYRNFTFIIFAGFLFFVAEFFIKNIMIVNGRMSVTEWLQLRFVPNSDMAFSLPIDQIVLVGIASIILLGLIQYFTICCRDGLYGNVWALNFIIWGAFSNVYDRITRGYVVDYIDISFWPIFNLADVAIFGGFVALIILISRQEKQKAYQLSEA